jgi:predicted exporter
MALMKRRTFIGLSASLATLKIPLLTGCDKPVEYDPTLEMPVTLAQMCDEKTLLSIGEQYLKTSSTSEKDQRALVDAILEHGNLKKTDKKQIETTLPLLIEKEYKNQQTVVVDGWILSETEARQCALYYLSHKQ